MNAPLLLEPRDGLPAVAHTPEEFIAAARALDAGRGPFAIDTERASDYRFDDRAFLIQIRRRDSGTFLIAPEGHRPECRAALAPVLNGQEWVLHAAASDLPALYQLGLKPGLIFDTEVSGRLLGLPKVNLAALTEDVLGVALEKQHGNEDWSTWPLPESWINYAALDVELLLELAEALTELLDAAGKLSWLVQECAHIAATAAPADPTWRDLKGVGKLHTSEQLLIAKTLWERRQAVGRERDQAPHKILANKAIIALATSLPTSREGVRSSIGRRASSGLVSRISVAMNRVRTSPKETWPQPTRRDYNLAPAPRSMWSSSFPDAQAALEAARMHLAELAEATHTPQENLIQPAILREIIWASVVTRKVTTSAQLRDYMATVGVRPWQQELTAPLLAEILI
ncbi:Ribonuclease D [Corynebacterium kalinowskii]|uniref:Ribonuclease D n=1 Tax=Corynebacterium kalinowskii TaxID=2675216 RepID=A0A6B8VTT3_9CORY|nr:HRDC domain-containing protein [Corynebacterium kalinowskii]QGU02176.1 Ribonuclease D [Corynebacterium kalinowskii]